jgi:hypothetical protein
MKNQAVRQFRQGDVFVVSCDTPKEALTELKPDKGRVILAYGEVTGHAHALSPKHVKLYDVKGWVERLLVVTKATALMHEEHGRIELPPGNYKVRIQKEYHPEEIRNVAD